MCFALNEATVDCCSSTVILKVNLCRGKGRMVHVIAAQVIPMVLQASAVERDLRGFCSTVPIVTVSVTDPTRHLIVGELKKGWIAVLRTRGP